MGITNYLIEGVSGSGKTSVCTELLRRGHHAIHGDRDLAYQGNPETGEPTRGFLHAHHIWNVERVSKMIADQETAACFFCGGSRNSHRFIHLFQKVFVLEIDFETLRRRLAARPPDQFGGVAEERSLVERLHKTRESIPQGAIAIDATLPIDRVVDEILSRCAIGGQASV